MKKVLKIAKNEVNLLFYSPIAWLLLIVFIIQCALTFIDLLSFYQDSQELGNKLKNLTTRVFGGRGVLPAIKDKLYLYIPLLTMGLFSKEYKNGSIKLLYSSPVTPIQVVMGKFLSMAFYGLVLCISVIPIIIVASFSIESLDLGLLLSGALGLFLLLCTYSAIGIFISSLTSYQVVSAIGTLAVLAGLNFVGKVGQGIEFFREITYWISISGRTSNFISGVINTRDIIYFTLVIALFLTLTVFRFQKDRLGRSALWNLSRYGIVIIIVLFVGYFSSLPSINNFYDATRFKQNTLTNSSKKLTDKIDSPLKITTYVNLLNQQFVHLGSPRYKIFERNQFERYLRYLPDTKMDYVFYYDSTYTYRDVSLNEMKDRADKIVLAYDFDPQKILTPEEIRSKINLKPENNVFVRKLEYKGSSTSLRMFFDRIGYPKEAEISAAIKRLLNGPSEIKFLEGQEEIGFKKRGGKSYREIFKELNLRKSLINQGFNVSSIKTDSLDPSHFTTLIIANPHKSFSKEEYNKIMAYVEEGGNLILTFSPSNKKIISPIIHNIGLSTKEGRLFQNSKEAEKNLILGKVIPNKVTEGYFSPKDNITLPEASALTYKDTLGFQTEPVIKTRANYVVWNEKLKDGTSIDTLRYNPDKDNKGIFTTAVGLTRMVNEKHQKILVISDANIFSNREISRSNVPNKNFDFATEALKWMSDSKYPIDVSRPDPIDNKIMISSHRIEQIKYLIVGLYPLLFLLLGEGILYRRKRK